MAVVTEDEPKGGVPMYVRLRDKWRIEARARANKRDTVDELTLILDDYAKLRGLLDATLLPPDETT